ncbi:MAG: hypothetical protein ABSC72_01140 [Methylovirgula sp.]|jgi:hypothetical protein
MESVYNAHPAEFGAHAATDGAMAKGFFVGEDQQGRIEVGAELISYKPEALVSFVDQPIEIDLSSRDVHPLLHNGHLEIIREFFGNGITERAKKIIDGLSAKKGPDADAAKFSAYVAAVRDWSQDPTIGGEIAAIILERGKGWRWFHRPDFCPES